jgi:hypothetical protein
MIRIRRAAVCALALLLLASCAQLSQPESRPGRWITLDRSSQRFSIDAQQVPRGALVDDLQSVSGVQVRPTPEREAPITAQGKDLDLDALLALLLPPETRITVRPGERELPGRVGGETRPKRGAPQEALAGTVPKPEAASTAVPARPAGAIKAAAEEKYLPREVSGAGAKRPVAELVATSSAAPKQPLSPRVPSETIRIQLQFEEGAAPRVIDARAIEGRAPPQRFVTGSFLFVVIGADGRTLEAGTFQDPLEEHSYLPEGQHSAQRARTGSAGISIARESLAGGVLRVVDLTGIALPRELDERTVRIALDRGKPVMQLDTAAIARRLQQEPRK